MDHNAQNVRVYNRFVREYMDRFMDLSLYRDSFDPLLEMLPARSSVLDLGCGPGNVVKYLKTKRADLRVLGIDLAPEMLRAARTANPGTEFRLMDVRDAGHIEDRFHAVIAAFCIPYLSFNDLPRLFHDFRRLAQPGGLIYLSFMEGPGDRSGFEKTSFAGHSELFISYYTRHEIGSLLKESGFDINEVLAKDYPEADGSVTTDLIYIASQSD